MSLSASTPRDLPAPWTGRVDGDGPEHRRWHQGVEPAPDGDLSGRTALIGFASDTGVRRNQGRPGAAAGPAALRRALSPLAFPGGPGSVVDAGDVAVEGDRLEAGQERLGARIAGLLDGGAFVVVLGGGHETAYGSYRGLAGSAVLGGGRRLGILNLDAHFDLRAEPVATSGTPFLQIAGDERQAGRSFAYAVLGISAPSNTRVLFDTAERLGVRHLTDEQCGLQDLQPVRRFVAQFLDTVDVLYLTIDLDVLPAAVAPGVSAPAGYGVALEVIHAVTAQAARSGKLALCDVVELSPPHDVDGRTARTAARLISTVVTERRTRN